MGSSSSVTAIPPNPAYRAPDVARRPPTRRSLGIPMDTGDLPPQLRPVIQALAAVIRQREPEVRRRVEQLRAEHPELGPDALARKLIRTTRYRVAATGAATGAVAIAPGLGTVLALGAAAGQGIYALEQE